MRDNYLDQAFEHSPVRSFAFDADPAIEARRVGFDRADQERAEQGVAKSDRARRIGSRATCDLEPARGEKERQISAGRAVEIYIDATPTIGKNPRAPVDEERRKPQEQMDAEIGPAGRNLPEPFHDRCCRRVMRTPSE